MEIKTSTDKSSQKITITLFLVYLVALIWILLYKMGVSFSYMGNRELNLIPFREYVLYNSKIDRAGTILNILIFIPFGIYIAILKPEWNIARKFFACFLLSMCIESLQYLLAIGAFDITDLITNTTGGIIGLTIYEVLKRMMKSHHKAQKLINIFAAAGTLFMIVLLFMLKLDMLPVRYR